MVHSLVASWLLKIDAASRIRLCQMVHNEVKLMLDNNDIKVFTSVQMLADIENIADEFRAILPSITTFMCKRLEVSIYTMMIIIM